MAVEAGFGAGRIKADVFVLVVVVLTVSLFISVVLLSDLIDVVGRDPLELFTVVVVVVLGMDGFGALNFAASNSFYITPYSFEIPYYQFRYYTYL